MARKRHTADQIISKLRETEVLLAKGTPMPQVCRKLGVTEQTYYRWRKEYGGVTVAPTSAGFWTPWFPLSLPQVWPFC
jgi:transposase-like protein